MPGHPGVMSLVRTERRNLLIFSGRSHMYEGARGAGGCVAIAAELGCRDVVLVQAAGSLVRSLRPASWLVASGVVCFPWRGAGGTRSSAGRPIARPIVSTSLRKRLEEAVSRAGEPLSSGVLYWTAGPCYETPAEGRAAAGSGAAAAAMSPLPELAEAASAGLQAACLSRITNYAPNAGDGVTVHEDVVCAGAEGAASLKRILSFL